MTHTKLDFPLVVYQENVLIMGMMGTGKTTLAGQLLKGAYYKTPRLIWSPQKPLVNYAGYGRPVSRVQDITGRSAQIWTGEFNPAVFKQICSHIMSNIENMLFVIDDVHEQVSKHKIDPAFSKLVNSGRNRGICNIFITPYPNLITSQLLQACRHRFCFRLDLESQVVWAEKNIYGPDAWLLFPKDMRSKEPNQYQDLEVLPQHSYIYRYDGHMKNQVIIHGK